VTAALRRADWRFLLPGAATGRYRHLVLLGGPPGLAELLRAEELAERIDTTPIAGADLVVALADASIGARELAACVSAGGVVYREVDRRGPGHLTTSPGRLRRDLAAAGLEPLWGHWVIPGFSQARRYLPLDHPEALRWYFSTLHPAGSVPGALAAAVGGLLSGGEAKGLVAVVPTFGITAVAPAWAGTVPELPALPGRWRVAGSQVVMLTSGQDDGSRVVLLPFSTDGAAPEAVVKISRTERFNAHTEREQATLTAIRAGLDAELRPSIPEPYGTTRFGRSLVALESYAPGASMVRSTGRRGEPLEHSLEDLRAAADWLARFHQQTTSDRAWGADSADRAIARLEAFRARLARSKPEHGLLDRAAAAARELVGAGLPTVLVHNDYGPWNIHRDGDRITVIDWELGPDTAGRRGPALADLIYFVAEWHLRARRLRGRQAELRGFRELFLRPTGPAAAAAAEVLSDYMRRVGVDSRFLRLFLVTTWADRAVDRADRQVTATGSVSGENRYADYVRLIATEAGDRFWGAAR
jgi:Ser/Thr protein kinase RdoA (MazF antagonist)